MPTYERSCVVGTSTSQCLHHHPDATTWDRTWHLAAPAWSQIIHSHHAQWTWSTWPGQYSCMTTDPPLSSYSMNMITGPPSLSCSMNMIHMMRSVLMHDYRSSTIIILNEHNPHDQVSTHAWLQIFHYHYAQWTWSTWPGQYSSIITDPPLHEHEHRSSTPIMLNEHDIHD